MDFKNIYVYLLLPIFIMAGCHRIEEYCPENELVEECDMIFYGVTESGHETKTMIDGEVGDDLRRLLWQPGDLIGVYNSGKSHFVKFENTNEETSVTGIFSGRSTSQDVYYAIYPFAESAKLSNNELIIQLPSVQNYAENSFGPGANPMVAKAAVGESFAFKNLCGVLAINLTGDVTVKSVSFSAFDNDGNPMPVCGEHMIPMDFVETPTLYSTELSKYSLSLDCGEGVQLNSVEPVPFHIVIPAANYGSCVVSISTTDGQLMVKQGKNPLKIKRSKVTSAGELLFVESVPFDLSENGTANSYMVHSPGLYSFDATVIGNGSFGMLSSEGFHTIVPDIVPKSVELLWEDKPAVTQAVSFGDGRVSFWHSGVEGNALIAAKDDEGNVIWSWHIWATDKSKDQTYYNDNGMFIVQDRHLGAISADRGDGEEWKESVGLYYQWGRKDPFKSPYYTAVNRTASLLTAIANPMLFFKSGGEAWQDETNTGLWSPSYKTIYDPCPAGYRIATNNIWQGFAVSESIDKGLYFNCNDTESAWYPASAWIDLSGNLINHDYESYVWSAEYRRNLHFHYNSLDISSGYGMANGFNVRCMKDDGADAALLTISRIIEGAEQGSIIIDAGYQLQGDVEVRKAGLVYSFKPDVTIHTGNVLYSESESFEFSIGIDNLEILTTYYVKAFVELSDGNVFYSNEQSFVVNNYSGEPIYLSHSQPSNCYIVYPAQSAYTFDLVKGNSRESVGQVSSLEVLWETLNSSDPVNKGDVIESVRLSGDKGEFIVPEKAHAGNALIVAKNQFGNIVWSWHIWVTDYDPDASSQTYISGAVMMDRNLGALSAVAGDTGVNGLFYQWGRKDPLLSAFDSNSWITSYPENMLNFISGDDGNTLEYTIANPTSFNYNPTWTHRPGLWDVNKTIYDPCPAGWRVPEAGGGVWAGITQHVQRDGGYYLEPPYSVPAAYYPGSGYIQDGNIMFYGGAVYSLSCNSFADASHSPTFVMFNNILDLGRDCGKGGGHTVRCTKDENYIDRFVPYPLISEVMEISSSTAVVSAEIIYDGDKEIVERGIELSLEPDFNEATTIKCNSGNGEFTCELSDLKNNTKYYVRAYAIYDDIRAVSRIKTFRTRYSDTTTMLSVDGTANCYIVPTAGNYCFDASVKGNGTESVGVPVSAEVIWETVNTTTAIEAGEIISSVSLQDGMVSFDAIGNEGNALVAVKDASDNILWSWHLWVTNYCPEEMSQKYVGNYIMMDRNLGALNVEHGDERSFGLFYQQGRKDPFVGCGDLSSNAFASTVPANLIKYETGGDDSYAIAHPYIVLTSYDTRWSDEKSINDPCPVGWKVPSSQVWDGFSSENKSESGSSVVFTYPASKPDAYYPLTGDTEMGHQSLRQPGTSGYLWTTSSGFAYSLVSCSKVSRSKLDENPVRCMKE